MIVNLTFHLCFLSAGRIPVSQVIMSELPRRDFIYLPSFEEYVMCQDFEQQLALIGFYRDFCKNRYERNDSNQDGRQGKFPAIIGSLWTTDNTLYALNATAEAYEDPADYLLMAAQIRDEEVKIDELKVLNVDHYHSDVLSIDKIIDAEWSETKKRATIRLGRQAGVMTLHTSTGMISHSPAL